MDDERLRAIEGLFWGASHNKEYWRCAIDAVATSLDATGSWLLPVRDRMPGAPHSGALAPMVHDYFRDGWFERDFRFRGVPTLMREGIVVDADLGFPEALEREESYHFLGLHKLRWFAAIAFEADGEPWAFSVHRTAAQGPFSAWDQVRLRRVRDIVNRAAALSSLVAEARVEGTKGELDGIDQGCLLLDRCGRPFWLNRRAEHYVGDAIGVAGGTVRALVPGEDATLQRHLQAALWDSIAPDAAALRPVLVQRPNGPPVRLQAFPIRGASFGYFAKAKVVVTITDAPAKWPRPIDRMWDAIGLSGKRAGPPSAFAAMWH